MDNESILKWIKEQQKIIDLEHEENNKEIDIDIKLEKVYFISGKLSVLTELLKLI